MRYVKNGVIGQDAQKDIPKPVNMVIKSNLLISPISIINDRENESWKEKIVLIKKIFNLNNQKALVNFWK